MRRLLDFPVAGGGDIGIAYTLHLAAVKKALGNYVRRRFFHTTPGRTTI
jgi:hypothetical protein